MIELEIGRYLMILPTTCWKVNYNYVWMFRDVSYITFEWGWVILTENYFILVPLLILGSKKKNNCTLYNSFLGDKWSIQSFRDKCGCKNHEVRNHKTQIQKKKKKKITWQMEFWYEFSKAHLEHSKKQSSTAHNSWVFVGF